MEPRAPEKHDAAAAIDAELEFHFAEVVEGLMERGWSEVAARKEAQRRFGDRVCYREDLVRLGRQRRPMEVADERHRGLAGKPVQTRLVAPGRALRGANPDAESGLQCRGTARAGAWDRCEHGGVQRRERRASPPAAVCRTRPTGDGLQLQAARQRQHGRFPELACRSQSLESLDAFEVNPFTNNRFTWTGDGEPEKVVGYRVTAGFFDILGVRPILGRTFAAGEDDPGRSRTWS